MAAFCVQRGGIYSISIVVVIYDRYVYGPEATIDRYIYICIYVSMLSEDAAVVSTSMVVFHDDMHV